MQLTFALSDEQFAANDYSGVMVGLPLAVQLHTGPLLHGRDEGTGWFMRTGNGPASLKPVCLERVAFCGRIIRLARQPVGDEMLHQALLDCGPTLRLDLFDPQQEAAKDATPFGLAEGDWLLGVAELRGYLAFGPDDLLWQPVQGNITAIHRLMLQPAHPDFGALRWLHGLPAQPFAPDQVFVTMKYTSTQVDKG